MQLVGSGSSRAGVQVRMDLSLCRSPLLLWLCRWVLDWGHWLWEVGEAGVTEDETFEKINSD